VPTSEPRTFYAADPHFWHRKIAEFCGRPYPHGDTATMNADLVHRWNSVVGQSDWVYVLGDFAFQLGRPESLDVAGRLNGVKILIPGNHDRCHPMEGPARSAQWRERYIAAGFADVAPPNMRKMIGGRWVWLSHFPYEGDSHDGDRFTDWRPVDDGAMFVVHGHVHAAWRQRGRQINVGLDAWGGYPVAEEMIADLISAGPADLMPLPWHPAGRDR
jgi:calcineurin-like phosphoesterase family protein